jgi:hypothetical protein
MVLAQEAVRCWFGSCLNGLMNFEWCEFFCQIRQNLQS